MGEHDRLENDENVEGAKHRDDTDVEAALQRETDDGKGENEPGETDFQGYATEGVEQGSDQ